MKIPKGWLKYQDMGQQVAGTKIIPFKVPLNEELCCPRVPAERWFTPSILLQRHPSLKAVIDLTDTSRYYDPEEFVKQGVAHVKIHIRGGGAVPPPIKLRQFFKAVDQFMKEYADDPDALVGVHCTHGLNRTGYFVCHYMVDRLEMSPDDAIAKFQEARGHAIHRLNFIHEIKQYKPQNSDRNKANEEQNVKDSKKRIEYSSPLGDSLYEYEEHSRRRSDRPSKTSDNWRKRDTSSSGKDIRSASFQNFNTKWSKSRPGDQVRRSGERRFFKSERQMKTSIFHGDSSSHASTSGGGNWRDKS